jgi:UDP-GlcNAc:undecaprenyl-phosphate/decaprenyl-phosphate GlcNAc-1-phosphate transferase
MIDKHYIMAFLMSFALVLVLTPLMRAAALAWGILDHPSTPVKTHHQPTPYLGGVAIYGAVLVTLFLLRLLTHFPTGTLRSLRGILVGSGFMVIVGLIDDIKPGGLVFQWKFFFQFIGALLLIYFDVRIKFIQPDWLSMVVTVLWVIGITNAFNIIDIMDGLACSQAFVASLGFFLISIPTEEIYVNFLGATVAGAALAFIPYNMSTRWKIFMGDTGSLCLGFLMAALSMGTSYTRVNEVGLFAPLLILGLPLYDTFFVSFLRIKQGKSPFLGSKDHLALKLRSLGLSPRRVVFLMAWMAGLCSLCGYYITWCPLYISIFLMAALMVVGLFIVKKLQKVQVP